MKLIALDLDGTLLNSRKEISPETVQAIKKAQNLGHVVMVLSGRAPESISKLLDEYQLDCPFGGSNGTAVFIKGKLLELISLTAIQNKKIFEVLEKEFIPYRLYTNKGILIPDNWDIRLQKALSTGDVPAEYYEDQGFQRDIKFPNDWEGVSSFGNPYLLLEDNSIAIQKFFILTVSPKQKRDLWKPLQTIEDIEVTTSAPFNIELMNGKGNKGNGLKIMANYFNIPLKDTVAIGDHMNDVAMFKAAGLSIAMGNAEEEVKKISNLVTLTNDENGAAYAIENFILNEV